MCAETAKRKAEEQKAVEAEADTDKKLSGGLSMEAVQAHTAGGWLYINTDDNNDNPRQLWYPGQIYKTLWLSL